LGWRLFLSLKKINGEDTIMLLWGICMCWEASPSFIIIIIKIVQIQNYHFASTTTKLHVRVFCFCFHMVARPGAGLVLSLDPDALGLTWLPGPNTLDLALSPCPCRVTLTWLPALRRVGLACWSDSFFEVYLR
jgi:hypothetical protein